MKVDIIIAPPVNSGKFANVKLAFKDLSNNEREVDLHINFQSLKDFSNDTQSVAFDLFLLSSLVYGIDNLLDRYQFSIDGWARDIEVSFPVNNEGLWNTNKEEFSSLLTFLTGDYWNISFEQISNTTLFIDRANRRKSTIPYYDVNEYSFSSLFSGGLDSLVGIIDGLTLLNNNEKGLLLSHFDSSSPGANSDQVKIENYLSNNSTLNSKYNWIQCVVSLDNKDSGGNEIAKEASYRSRSLLFIGIALFCVENLPNCNILTIPENGTISLNFPLTPSRTSTLSTRTTHPFYINQLQILINKVGLKTQLKNPYEDCTKGELLKKCLNNSILSKTYQMSVSCGKRGRKMHWDTKSGTHQCGICMPCIYRRAALHQINLDNELYGIDIFTTTNEIFDKYDFPALINFLNNNLTTEQIKRTLLVSGSIDYDSLDESASLVERVKVELRDWIRSKGTKKLKALVHIK